MKWKGASWHFMPFNQIPFMGFHETSQLFSRIRSPAQCFEPSTIKWLAFLISQHYHWIHWFPIIFFHCKLFWLDSSCSMRVLRSRESVFIEKITQSNHITCLEIRSDGLNQQIKTGLFPWNRSLPGMRSVGSCCWFRADKAGKPCFSNDFQRFPIGFRRSGFGIAPCQERWP